MNTIELRELDGTDDFVYPELELEEMVVSREGDIIFIEDPLNDLETYTLTLPEALKLVRWLQEHALES